MRACVRVRACDRLSCFLGSIWGLSLFKGGKKVQRFVVRVRLVLFG